MTRILKLLAICSLATACSGDDSGTSDGSGSATESTTGTTGSGTGTASMSGSSTTAPSTSSGTESETATGADCSEAVCAGADEIACNEQMCCSPVNGMPFEMPPGVVCFGEVEYVGCVNSDTCMSTSQAVQCGDDAPVIWVQEMCVPDGCIEVDPPADPNAIPPCG